MNSPEIKQCCAAFYGSDLARLLLGDSFHPGGTALTGRLGELLGLSCESQVLDVASGRGDSAFYLAETLGCRVIGIDLSEENVYISTAETQRRGLCERVSFQLADAEGLPFAGGTFDAIVCECAFCTFPNKATAAQEFHRVLKPDGQIGLSDLTREGGEIPGLEGLLSWISCIGEALPAKQYAAIFEETGFEVRHIEDHGDALVEMVRQIQAKLLGAEIVAGLKKMSLPSVDFTTAKAFAQAALRATHNGSLGYGVLTAGKKVNPEKAAT
jgi:ubiquinone/menaquinone biosynthesis C-methylase UbiE